MRIAISGKGTYAARGHLKKYKLRWAADKHAWVGDVDRLTVSIIRTGVMTDYRNMTLTFEDKAQEEEYYGWPRWECSRCENIIRKEDCKFDGAATYICPFCKSPARLLEE